MNKFKEKEDLAIEIYEELDFIRAISMLALSSMQNGDKNIREDTLSSIFNDIKNRSWNISEKVERFEKLTE